MVSPGTHAEDTPEKVGGHRRIARPEPGSDARMKGRSRCSHHKQGRSQPGKIVCNIHDKELVTHEKHSFKLIKIDSQSGFLNVFLKL